MTDEKGPKYEGVSPRSEEEILSFWKENKIFEKSLESRKKGECFVFYEGPPYANGLPGIHHVESRSFKDIILRYKTMRGFYVPRRAGWDTHGLPTEMAVEKELKINSKREIEEKIGVEKFVETAKKNVFTYIGAWEKLTDRMAYWLDLENAYVTMTNNYIESLWAIVSEISKKGFLYEDYKVLPWCTRCGTSLSSHELALGYKKVKEDSIYVKVPLRGRGNTTSFLVWTTTPWTLPGNVALAINPKADYVTIEPEDSPGEWLILAEKRLSVIRGAYKIINRVNGKSLAGMEYDPLYPAEKKEKNIYRAVAADFVSTEDGSGIVHIAPAFGKDDMEIGKKEKLPILVTVNEEGRIIAPGKSWHGEFIKKADPLIIEDLKDRSLLYKTESYLHDYPFCWRCGTPLMYYAKNSWFFKTTAVKEKMLEENSKIDWHPSHLKDGRFGEWLKENVDWGISRERYWGAPLPVWKCSGSECGSIKVIGSLAELDELELNPTNLILMRHGEAMHNVEKLTTIDPENDSDDKLTEAGIKAAGEAAKKLKKEKIDVIVSSPSYRTKETAEIVRRVIGFSDFETDKDLYEILVMGFAGKPLSEYRGAFESDEERFTKRPLGAENLRELRARVMRAAKRIREKYAGKNILVISHGDPARVMEWAIKGLEEKDFKNIQELRPAEFRKIRFHNWPYSSEGTLDIHKPYIDEIKIKCKACGGEMLRQKEVIDVWFDSGAMPFASQGWKLGNSVSKWIKRKPSFLYPADYICEAIDQTRGWFYTLLAVSSLLGFKSSYKMVISLGLVLDEKGEKMSKSKGNVVDPQMLMEKYGADAVRWYFYTVNQPWDDKLFREKDIQDSHRRFLMILWNSFVYWRTYRGAQPPLGNSVSKWPKLVINKWLLVKWNSILGEATGKLDAYDIVGAARALENFVIEDLSHWYIRRIRGHMKSEKSEVARESSLVLGFILGELSKVLAPFAPFVSEGIYHGISGEKESVHLEDWPKFKKENTKDRKLIDEMEKVREIVTKALELRQKAGIKIRQPLAELIITTKLQKELFNLIKGEINVKEISFGKELKLDTNITQELKEEGLVREFIRQVQDFRKELKLTPKEKVSLFTETDHDLEIVLKKYSDMILREINLSEFKLGKLEGKTKEFSLDGKKTEIGIYHVHHVEIES
ncbi:class I tRNA ligase family protein [Candidatus Giovannonibacteria bacterium]|nr:class I tRNA ligase family protein [Candidatus Giovannonibacteria bacterium]